MIAIVSLVWGLGEIAQAAPREFKCEQDRWQACAAETTWQTKKFRTAKGKPFTVRYLKSSPAACGNESYPSIEVNAPSAMQWIQIIETNSFSLKDAGAPGLEVELPKIGKVYVDTSGSHAAKGLPFYTDAPQTMMADSPCFEKLGEAALNWQAFVFALEERHGRLAPVFAGSWGYAWDSTSGQIKPMDFKRVSLNKWKNYRGLMREKFPALKW
ncbi:MAG: hypothetical protein AB7P04_10210 [Bacteriovoracia bacterium]